MLPDFTDQARNKFSESMVRTKEYLSRPPLTSVRTISTRLLEELTRTPEVTRPPLLISEEG